MAHKYGFEIKQLSDFVGDIDAKVTTTSTPVPAAPVAATSTVTVVEGKKFSKTEEQLKLERANAINKILSKPILKFEGPVYDHLEGEIRNFLNDRLGELFSGTKTQTITADDITIVKEFVKILKDKKKG